MELALLSLHIEAKATSLSNLAALHLFPIPLRRASLPGLDRDPGFGSFRRSSIPTVWGAEFGVQTGLSPRAPGGRSNPRQNLPPHSEVSATKFCGFFRLSLIPSLFPDQ